MHLSCCSVGHEAIIFVDNLVRVLLPFIIKIQPPHREVDLGTRQLIYFNEVTADFYAVIFPII